MNSGGETVKVLPRHEHAIIPMDKFTQYALNPDREPDKAKAFELALGYNLSNYRRLMGDIFSNLANFCAVEKITNGYGQRFEVIMRLLGPNAKEANILTGWIIEKEGGAPRLTSVYVTKKVPKG